MIRAPGSSAAYSVTQNPAGAVGWAPSGLGTPRPKFGVPVPGAGSGRRTCAATSAVAMTTPEHATNLVTPLFMSASCTRASSARGLREVRPRRRLVPERSDLIGIHANHQVGVISPATAPWAGSVEREHPDRPTLRHPRVLARKQPVEHGLHAARGTPPPGLHGDVMPPVDIDRRRRRQHARVTRE